MSSALTTIAYDVVVSHPIRAPRADPGQSARPDHHLNDAGTKFANPWASFSLKPFKQWAKVARFFFTSAFDSPAIPSNISDLIPTQKPTWGVDLSRDDVKATWLGHACYLVELPTPKGAARGPRIIFDPVFSNRCSPSQWVGPMRFTPTPCKLEDIPAVDAIVISHNHYDHTDSNTITYLSKRYDPHVFMPLGNREYLLSLGIPESHVHLRDWWEESIFSFSLPTPTFLPVPPNPKVDSDKKEPSVSVTVTSTPTKPAESDLIQTSFKVTSTPSQHVANRGPLDRWKSLWCSWVIEEIPEVPGHDNNDSTEAVVPAKKVYFAGDTGYRTLIEGEDEDSAPVCPAFKEIGEKFGPFDLALIPIGAYNPRWLFSNVHVHPSESVRIFQDVKAKKALAMHWGTWVLTLEPVTEPPEVLKEEAEKAGIPEGDFDTCGLGETRAF